MAVKMYKCQRGLKLPVGIAPNLDWFELDNSANSEMKELLYNFAKCFTKELDFDPAYCYPFDNSSKYQAFVMVNEGKAIGACAFHSLANVDPEVYCLQWVWLIPGEKINGNFQKLWDSFTSGLNQIAIGFPISEPMQAFIKKQQVWRLKGSRGLTAESGSVLLEKIHEHP